MQQLQVNGRSIPVNAPADTPLLWILRDVLGLTGTKFGCGTGLCGVCTVLMNAEPVRSCTLPLSQASGAITTIEGISERGDHPLQQAWLAEQVPQCGYCQSGQIMSALALLLKNARPSEADIDAAMSGVLCRCGTYPRIRAAIRRATLYLNLHGAPPPTTPVAAVPPSPQKHASKPRPESPAGPANQAPAPRKP